MNAHDHKRKPFPPRAPSMEPIVRTGLPAPEPLKPLPPGDFENFCRGVKELLGVDLSLYKRKQMERRARGLASRNHAETLTEYLHMLQKDAVLLDRFMERMTITVSQLWRNADIFEAIENEILPELDKHADGRKLKLWSAGCSYGAEPYTLAVDLPRDGQQAQPHAADQGHRHQPTDDREGPPRSLLRRRRARRPAAPAAEVLRQGGGRLDGQTVDQAADHIQGRGPVRVEDRCCGPDSLPQRRNSLRA